MDKNIYLYLSVFVVLYLIFRLNSSEHFGQEPMQDEPVTVYIKSKYNLQNDMKELKIKQEQEKMKVFKIKQDQIKQFELAKTHIINAQNQELSIKQQQLEAKLKDMEEQLKLEEDKRMSKEQYDKQVKKEKDAYEKRLKEEQKIQEEQMKIEQKIQEEQMKIEQKIQEEQMKIEQKIQEEQMKIEQKEKEEQIKIEQISREQERKIEEKRRLMQMEIVNMKNNKKDDLKKDDLKKDGYLIKTYEKTKEYAEIIQKKIYEFMTASSPTIFNTAKTCGFSYTLYQVPSSIPKPQLTLAEQQFAATFQSNSNPSTTPTNSIPYLYQGQMFMNSDKTQLILHYADKAGLTGINIRLAENTLLITDGVSSYQISIRNFNSKVNSAGLFSVDISLSGIPDTFFNSTSTYILFDCSFKPDETPLYIEHNLWISFLVFVGLVVFSLLVINYKLVYNFIFPSKTISDSNNVEGGKNIFYIGGYDYRDYSD